MVLIYLLPLVPYFLLRLKDLKIVAKLIFISLAEMAFIVSSMLLLYFTGSNTIAAGMFTVALLSEMLLIANVVVIIVLVVLNKIKKKNG